MIKKILNKVKKKGLKGSIASFGQRVVNEYSFILEEHHYKNTPQYDLNRIDLGKRITWEIYRNKIQEWMSKEGQGVRLFLDYLKDKLRQDNRYSLGTIDAAQAISEKRLKVYGHEFSFQDTVLWNKDLTLNGVWPHKYWRRYRFPDHRGKRGDYRFVWEMNRHQYFLILAMAYHETKEPVYADTMMGFIESWIEQNPPYKSLNWASAMEISLRIMSWLYSLALLSDYDDIAQQPIDLILKSIYQQSHFLNNHLSVNIAQEKGNIKLRNNHTIVELCGLLVSCSMLAWIPAFRDLGSPDDCQKSLLKEVQDQFYDDGMHVEQSTSYSRFTLEALMLCALSQSDRAFCQHCHQWIEKGKQALESFLYTDERFILVGDEDNGHGLISVNAPKPDEISDVRLLFDSLSSYCRCLGGENFPKKESPPIQNQRFHLLPDSGHWVGHYQIKGRQVTVYFRAGPMAFPHIPGYAPHVHADLLSFALFVDGTCVLCDSGTGSYHHMAERNELRSSKSHNTIQFMPFDQMEILGPFNAKNFARGEIIYAEQDQVAGKMTIERDGDRVAVIERQIRIIEQDGALCFQDTVESNRSGTVLWYLNLNPLFDVSAEDPSVLLENGNVMAILNGDGMFGKVESGLFSPEYGNCIGTKRLISEKTYIPGQKMVVEWTLSLGHPE